MLKITKASDPITVERLNMVVYGPSTTAATAPPIARTWFR
jgi:hypothetical protein